MTIFTIYYNKEINYTNMTTIIERFENTYNSIHKDYIYILVLSFLSNTR